MVEILVVPPSLSRNNNIIYAHVRPRTKKGATEVDVADVLKRIRSEEKNRNHLICRIGVAHCV